jgi:hypothetical protein
MRQTGYQVKTDVFEARGTRLPDQFASICGRMQPPHRAEFPVLERLRSNAQTIHTHAHGLSQELHIGRARSDFDREFTGSLDSKAPMQGTDDLLESFHPQQRWGSPSEIDGVHRECENLFGQPINLKTGWQPVDFLFHRLAITVEDTAGFDPRTEVAEAALRGAKWNFNVDGERLHD